MSEYPTSVAKNNLDALDFRLLSFGSPPTGEVLRRSFRWTERGREHNGVDPTEMNAQALTYHAGNDHQVHEHNNSAFCRGTDASREDSNHLLDTRPASHINLFPPEILSEIFIHCLPDYDSRGPHYRIHDVPVSLTHVCGYWRQVALSLSILWSSFSVFLCPKHDVVSTSEALRMWLNRSETWPLIFRLRAVELVPALLPHVHRWEHIDLVVNEENADRMLDIPMASAPALKSINVVARGCTMLTLNRLFSLVHSIPRLRRLSWHCEQTPSAFLDVSFSHLTHIVFSTSIHVDHFIPFLSGCEHLVSIVAHRLEPPRMLMENVVIVLPHLVSLDVKCAENMRDLLDHLTLPSLLRLRLDESTKIRVTYEKHQTLANLIARSSCQLENLELHDFEMTEDDLIGYLTLPCLQYIQKLDFLIRNFSERAVGLLTYHKPDLGRRNVFPRLTRLRVRFCTALDGLFSEMVASRWIPTRRPVKGMNPLR